MKYFLLLCLIGVTQFAVAEQQYIAAACFSLKETASLLNEFNEEPFVTGRSVRLNPANEAIQTAVIIFANPQTKTWTIVEKIEDQLYCVLATGTHLQPAKLPNNEK